jgi:hypothetical protein
MSELSQTINIRTTFEMKKRILESEKILSQNQRSPLIVFVGFG